MVAFVQPVAQHGECPERLLLRGADGRWYVWLGRSERDRPEEVERTTADWLRRQAAVEPLDGQRVWLHVDDLPVAAEAAAARARGEEGAG